jgi:YcxB-like protein
MEYTVRVTYDRAMIGEAARQYGRRTVGWIMPVACLLLLFGLVGLLLGGDRSWVVGVFGAVLVLGMAAGVAVFVVPYRRALAKFEAMTSRSAESVFRESGFIVRSELGGSELAWSTVERILRAKRVWLLCLRGATYLTLPLADLPNEVRSFIEKHVHDNGGHVR